MINNKRARYYTYKPLRPGVLNPQGTMEEHVLGKSEWMMSPTGGRRYYTVDSLTKPRFPYGRLV